MLTYWQVKMTYCYDDGSKEWDLFMEGLKDLLP